MSEFSVSPPRGGGVANATEIQGVPVSDVAPTETQVLAFDGTEYVPTGPAAGVVASLSGAGITDSPGILDQAGGMSIDDSEGDGFSVTTNGGITLSDDSDGGVVIAESGAGGINLTDTGAGGINLTDTGTGGLNLQSVVSVLLGIDGANAPVISMVASAGGLINFAPNTNATSQNFNLFCFDGDPNGEVTAIAEGDLCVDTSTPGLWQAPGAGTAWTALGGGGGGGASLCWPGVDASPGKLYQAGGMWITDAESDGFSVTTDASINLTPATGLIVQSAGGVQMTDTSDVGFLLESAGTGPIQIYAQGGGDIAIFQFTVNGSIKIAGAGDGAAYIGIGTSADGLGFFGDGGELQQTVTGALSTVADPSAQAVLTSIINALGPDGYNLFLDGTS